MYVHTYGVHTPPSTIFVPTDLPIIIIPSTECLNKLEHKHSRYNKHHENEHTLLLYTELFDRVDHN